MDAGGCRVQRNDLTAVRPCLKQIGKQFVPAVVFPPCNGRSIYERRQHLGIQSQAAYLRDTPAGHHHGPVSCFCLVLSQRSVPAA